MTCKTYFPESIVGTEPISFASSDLANPQQAALERQEFQFSGSKIAN